MERLRGPGPPSLPRVVLRSELGKADFADLLSAGTIARVRHGAYMVVDQALTEPWATRQQYALARCVAVVRASAEPRILSHESAALLHGCPLWRTPERVHLIQPTRHGARRASDVLRHTVDLEPSDVTTINGLAVTTLQRTVLDCARTLHARDALVVADSALRLLAKPDRWRRAESQERMEGIRAELGERLESGRARRGRVRARAVLSAANGFAESPGESVLRWIAVSRGIGRPIAQFRTQTDRGTYFSDLAWCYRRRSGGGTERWVVHAEFDGRIKYHAETPDGGAEAVVEEKLREDAIREAGGVVLRFVSEDLHRPDATAERLVRAMPARLMRGARAVPGLYLPE
ncbi:hypothetical protein ACO0LV_03105 [Pseudactinotalea sp. Z1739]|uniref:hypothetical protein n=1 Tax=Pseudactinotalea sp. Z1739 TaxID=3413028 RepID=UPI003C7E8976